MRITRHIATQEATDEHWQREAFNAKARCRASLVRILITASRGQSAHHRPTYGPNSPRAIPIVKGYLYGQTGA
ncbi:MAG: hypothetical protein IT435_10465 [Phycisphaerales bacterium]|nr:hypothetical protein [Phycisphaerales bacterium]